MSELPRRKMGRTGMQPKALGMGAAFVNRVDEAETIATNYSARVNNAFITNNAFRVNAYA